MNKFWNRSCKKSLERRISKNNVIAEPKKRTITWFFVKEEKDIEMLINKAESNIAPIYPIIISGRYRVVKKERENSKTHGKK